MTLTATEAANVIQKYTGTLSGNVTVNIPQVIQVYYITNQTDGTGAGYEITFTTGISGAATATVPAGQQVILLCDSVNVFNASTVAAGASTLSLVNGTAAVPSLNFASETDTGVYRPASGEFGITILGNQRLNVTATGIDVTGDVGCVDVSATGNVECVDVNATGDVAGVNFDGSGTGTFTGGISGGTFT